MYCKHCGQEIKDDATFCPFCGGAVNVEPTAQAQGPAVGNGDAPSTGYAVLGFFIPIVGLILYLIWKQQYPLRAKSAGKGALIGFIVSIIFEILFAVLGVAIGLSAASAAALPAFLL
ncbi:MAG: zinc ribbon domain-containing protein [Clostridia bacterium]|nr:zinc ribbon domain-containing protein [Clostridia bacterium]